MQPSKCPRSAPGRAARGLLLLAPLLLPVLVLAPMESAWADAPVPFSKILDRIEKHAVQIVVRFQKDLEAEASGAVAVDPNSSTESFRRWRMSLRVPAFLVRDRRTVITSDVYLPPGTIKSIEVEDRAGKAVPATITAFLRRSGAVVLETTADVDADPVPFDAAVTVTPETPLFVGSLSEGLRGLETWAQTLDSARRRAFVGKGFSYGPPERQTAGLRGIRGSRTTDLVTLPDGTPLGFRFGGSIDLEESIWKGPEVLKEMAAAIPLEALLGREQALQRTSFVHQVKITFRAAEDESGGGRGFPYSMRGFSFSNSRGSGGGEPENDAKRYALAIAPNTLVVPEGLPDEWVKRIEKVVVEDEGKTPLDATYEGRVKGWAAFVIRLSTGAVPAPTGQPIEAPASESAFLVHQVAWRTGARRDRVEYNRSLGTSRGYGDRLYFTSEQAVDAGSFLLDVDGGLLGFAADMEPEDADSDSAANRRGGVRRSDPSGVSAVLFSEIGGAASLAANLDKKVMPAPAVEAKRIPWLGVEYQTIGKEVAEALGVEAPTRDGERGLMIDTIYDGSPAAKAGLKDGDILLSAKKTSGPGSDSPPVDLRDGDASSSWNDDSEAPRPWRPRENAVVRLLTTWGVGTTFDLEYWRDGQSKTISLVVEQSPRDNASAMKARDEGTGLTVKEMTYEVRAALRLAPDAPGVVIADVKEGSPAAQAHIYSNEFIREIDGNAVLDPESFAAMLKAAREAKREQVRIVVARLNRTRFVDLRLAAATGDEPPSDAPAPGGGMEDK